MGLPRGASPSIACLLAGLAGSIPWVRAQTPYGQAVETLPTQRVELVQLEIVVTDKHGRPRAGLGPDDFVILEDGTPQPVVQFHAFERPTVRVLTGHAPGRPDVVRAEGAPPASPDVPPTRYVVLVVDNLHMEFSSLVPFRKALGRFITQDLRPEDQVALVTTSVASAVSQEFTADRAVLRQTLSRLSAQGRGWGTEVPHLSEYQAELIEGDDVMALQVAAQEILQAGLAQGAGQAEQMARDSARAVSAEAAYNSRLTLGTLERVCRGLSGLTGHKALFLVSDGFATGLGSRSGAAFDVRQTADTCSRAGVVIHALDTRGLIATPRALTASSPVSVGPASIGLIWAVEGRSEEGMRDAMHSLAAETGGFLVASSNNLGAGLSRMLEDTETYYLLAYDPTNTKRDGGFRRIEVRVPGVPGVKVRTRSGYFAPADPSPEGPASTAEAVARRAKERLADMRAAFSSLAPLTAIPVHLSADFVSFDAGAIQVVVSGNVGVTTLPFARRRDRLQATIETAALVYDEGGAVAATLKTERTTLDLTAAAYGQLRRRGIPYRQAAPLIPGRYQVRLATREDATGLLGSAWFKVEIPDLAAGRLTLGSLFLLKDDGASAQAGPDAAPALHSVQGRPRFGRGESLYLQFSVYNAKRDVATGAIDLASQAEVLRKGAVLATAAPEALSAEASGPTASHLSRIRLQPFEPGDYELRVVVSDHNAKASASRTVPFTVDGS